MKESRGSTYGHMGENWRKLIKLAVTGEVLRSMQAPRSSFLLRDCCLDGTERRIELRIIDQQMGGKNYKREHLTCSVFSQRCLFLDRSLSRSVK